MKTIVVELNDKSEFNIFLELIKKFKLKAKILSREDKEDIGLLKLMNEADRNKKVSENTIIKKLKS